ncbi:MAG: hemerythrin domain-containing protein [Acidobacteriales bacterium]|nr:hemerythrin domain-containing protein [Terriglobales bacterium]
MLRDPSLIPLSRQHQHALALCVRIDRGVHDGDELRPWQIEVEQLFQQEIAIHFAAEEKIIFPAAAKFPELRVLVTELIAEHAQLRESFSRAEHCDAAGLRLLGQRLALHIRKEERQLFEGMQQRMPAEDLAAIGSELNRELEAVSDACLLPSETTRIRPAK